MHATRLAWKLWLQSVVCACPGGSWLENAQRAGIYFVSCCSTRGIGYQNLDPDAKLRMHTNNLNVKGMRTELQATGAAENGRTTGNT